MARKQQENVITWVVLCFLKLLYESFEIIFIPQRRKTVLKHVLKFDLVKITHKYLQLRYDISSIITA